MYFSNSHASRDLPIPATPTTETSCARDSSARRVEEVLQKAQLALAADERCFEARRPTLAASVRDHAERPEQRHGLGLALQLVLACVAVVDRRLAGAPRCIADEHGARLGGRLDPRGGVDEVARDHALVGRAQRDRRFAGEDAGARPERGVEARHRLDELERRPHRPFGVVLVRDRGAPDGHHGVADELLDGAAVALDDRAARCRSSGSGARACPRRRVPPRRS